MRVEVHNSIDNSHRFALDSDSGFTIGRAPGSHVRLESDYVSLTHLYIDRISSGWRARVAPDAQPVQINNSIVRPGQSVRLLARSTLLLAQFVVQLDEATDDAGARPDRFAELHRLQHRLHTLTLDRLDLRRLPVTHDGPALNDLRAVDDAIEHALRNDLRPEIFGDAGMRSRLLAFAVCQRLESANAKPTSGPEEVLPARSRVALSAPNPILEQQAQTCVARVRAALGDAQDQEDSHVYSEERVAAAVATVEPRLSGPLIEFIISRFLKKLTCDLVFGLGPLQDLLDMPDVDEIMIVEPSVVFIEHRGRLVRSNRTFVNDQTLISIIERIVSPLGRRIDRSQPLVDARLKDGSRINAVIPPLAIKGPCLTIRKFSRRGAALDLLVRERRSLPPAAAALLDAAVRARKNILVAGGTGAGKTTLLNALGRAVSPAERLITVEDSAELHLEHPHVVALEARPPNSEGAGEYTIRDLVRNALRMRPDRIIVGECRGPEALDMLQAMNTGHAGSMTTIHANSAEDVIPRLETLVASGSSIPLPAIRRQIAQALDLIVYIERHDERRLVSQITEVLDIDPMTGELDLADIFRLQSSADGPVLSPTGSVPTFLEDIVESGLLEPHAWLVQEISC